MENIIFFYRGKIERWSESKKSYIWMDGYSENGNCGPLYPWMTKSECIRDAKNQNLTAVFK